MVMTAVVCVTAKAVAVVADTDVATGLDSGLGPSSMGSMSMGWGAAADVDDCIVVVVVVIVVLWHCNAPKDKSSSRDATVREASGMLHKLMRVHSRTRCFTEELRNK